MVQASGKFGVKGGTSTELEVYISVFQFGILEICKVTTGFYGPHFSVVSWPL